MDGLLALEGLLLSRYKTLLHEETYGIEGQKCGHINYAQTVRSIEHLFELLLIIFDVRIQ